jgi:hypothetical protein
MEEADVSNGVVATVRKRSHVHVDIESIGLL